MMGERVCVLRRVEGPPDAMGDPVVSWEAEEVEGVLVRPMPGADAAGDLHPHAATVEYRLAFPKSYTASCRPLRGARVALVGRGMDGGDAASALRVVGSPDSVTPCPTAWDTVAEVGRVLG